MYSAGAMPQRYVVVVLGCLGMAMNYILRINMNLAIVAMTGAAPADGNASAHHELNECNFLPENSTLDRGGYVSLQLNRHLCH